jgi:hypothetical protein
MSPRSRSVAAAFAVSFVIAFTPAPARAFKIDTHVWTAMQVLDDLWPDCRLSFGPPLGDYDVDQATCDAVRNHPEAYLMGAIGPDGFPDVVGGQMTTHPGAPHAGELSAGPGLDPFWRTDDWLRHVFAAAAASGSEAARAFAFGYATHAAGDVFAHTYVNTYTGDVFELFDGEIDVELRHMMLEDYIRRHMPPLVDPSGATRNPWDVVDVPVEFVRDTLLLNAAAAGQYDQTLASKHLALMYGFWAKLDQIVGTARDVAKKVTDTLAPIQAQIDFLEADVCVLGFCVKRCYAIDPIGCEATLAGLRATRDLLQPLVGLTADSMVAPFLLWRGDVETAMADYVLASRDVSREIMKPDGNPIAPVEGWICRDAPAFAAVPVAFTRATCDVKDYVSEATDAISSFRSAVADKLGILGWAVDPAIEIQNLVDKELKEAFQELPNQLAALADQDSTLYALAIWRSDRPDDARLNAKFGTNSSSKALLLIPDVAQRVQAEMHLRPDGTFDPEQYAVVYDAVILSKMVLLLAPELNRMARVGGVVGETAYGSDLYGPVTPFSALIGAVASIDGSHQWQEVALPYPREGADPSWPDHRRFGRPFPDGFRPWQDCQAHRDVFEKVFKGPLVPGIEAPASIGFAPPDGYVPPFKPTDEHPFPLAVGQSRIIDLTAPRPVPDPLPKLQVECGVPVTFRPQAADNCAAPSSIQVSTTDPLLYPVPGNYQIQWTLNDGASSPENGGSGNSATYPQQIEVRDTTPPQLGLAYDGPLCLWSPHHDYVVLKIPGDLSPTITDACDPHPRLVLVSATSSQPDDATGDGHTTHDVVVWPDHVCLRAERQGNVRSPRQYELRFAAVDASGNRAEQVLSIAVSHDQRAHDCPTLPASTFVDDGDPLCQPPPPPPPPSPVASALSGCGSPAGAPALLAVVGLLGLVRRRATSPTSRRRS